MAFIQRSRSGGYLVRDVEFAPASMSRRKRIKEEVYRHRPVGLAKSDWNKRYTFFSRFDEGVEMDEEAWYETTPENISEYISHRIPYQLGIIDGFCGVGGNTIQFTRFHAPVIAVDISSDRIRMCRNNCRIYGVEQSIAFQEKDVLKALESLDSEPSNMCFYASPPWGGKSCYNTASITISSLPADLDQILELAFRKLNSIALHLPRNTDLDDLANFLHCRLGVTYFEVERVFFTEPERRLKVILVYIDKSVTGRDSVLSIGRESRRRTISTFLGNSTSARIMVKALICVNYVGRFVSESLRQDAVSRNISVSATEDPGKLLASLV